MLLLGTIFRLPLLFRVEAILCVLCQTSFRANVTYDLLQKLFNILAALSLSLSIVVGQNASLPSLLLSLFTGAPSKSSVCQALSKPFLLPVFSEGHHVDCGFAILACAFILFFYRHMRRSALSFLDTPPLSTQMVPLLKVAGLCQNPHVIDRDQQTVPDSCRAL